MEANAPLKTPGGEVADCEVKVQPSQTELPALALSCRLSSSEMHLDVSIQKQPHSYPDVP